MSHSRFTVHGESPSLRWATAEHTWFKRWRVTFLHSADVIVEVPGLAEKDACDLAEAWGRSEDYLSDESDASGGDDD